MKVTLHEAAREEVADAVNHYRQRSLGLGDRFRRAVDEAARVALRHPYAGSEVRPEIRRDLVSGFPYALIYRYEDSEAEYWCGSVNVARSRTTAGSKTATSARMPTASPLM